MKDSSISKHHLFSGVSVMVIAYLTLTTVVFVLEMFQTVCSRLFRCVAHTRYECEYVFWLVPNCVSRRDIVAALRGLFSFSYQYFGVLYLTQEGVLLKAPFKRRIYIPYPEIRELGIDVGTTKQFWIFISKQKSHWSISTGSTRSAVPPDTNGSLFHTLISCWACW